MATELKPQATDAAPDTGHSADGPAGEAVYFMADAHLGAESQSLESEKLRDLIGLLSHLQGCASFLYIVGDLFDFWFEYPTVTPTEHFEVLKALSELSRAGTEIRILGGNHDYWAGEKLEAMAGATVVRDTGQPTHFGRKLFVAHGDGLPAGDWGYRMLKAVIRSRPAIAAFRLLHPTTGAALARWASGLSEITEGRILKAVPPMKDFLERKLGDGYDAAIVGHVHRPFIWRTERGTAVIVGDWMANRSVVELTPDGFRMLRWSDGSLVESDAERSAAAP
jgi:UDP-2,3-diacylglucosamine hydrolase